MDNSYLVKRDNLDTMRTIAEDRQTIDDIKMLTSSKVTDQLKVFLVSQARNELMRVVKLTEFLDKIESSFLSKVDQAMMDEDLTLKQYSDIIGVITTLLSRSGEIISKVLKDDSLMTILNTTIYSDSYNVSQTSIISQLKDAQSRERVRSVLQQVIRSTKDYSPGTDSLRDSEGDVEEEDYEEMEEVPYEEL